jgi:hypothetical protein
MSFFTSYNFTTCITFCTKSKLYELKYLLCHMKLSFFPFANMLSIFFIKRVKSKLHEIGISISFNIQFT